MYKVLHQLLSGVKPKEFGIVWGMIITITVDSYVRGRVQLSIARNIQILFFSLQPTHELMKLWYILSKLELTKMNVLCELLIVGHRTLWY